MLKSFKSLLLTSVILLCTFSVHAEVLYVDDTNVNDVIRTASPGDEIVFQNGVYVNVVISLEVSGTAEAPITLRADSVGKVIFIGKNSALRFFGEWCVVDGFRWFNIHKEDSVPVILFEGATNNVFKNNEIYNSGAVVGSSSRGVIRVMESSQNNIIENNRFDHSLSMGIQVWCWDNDTNNTDNIIRSNHFVDHVGGEILQLGQGSDSAFHEQRTIIENNLFENITMADPELISNKTSKNIIRHNTFRNCNSMVVMRTGSGSIVDGNWFFNSKGIRVHDRDHVIINNYIEGSPSLINVDNEGITLYTGNMQRPDTDGSHYVAKNVLVANNTIINHESEHIQVGRNHTSWSIYPDSCTIINNLVINDKGIGIDVAAGTNITSDKNIVWSTGDGTNGNADNAMLVDPLLTLVDGIYRTADGSPAIGAALIHANVQTDIDGQNRDDAPDIGADEVSADPVVNTPQTSADCGPVDMPDRQEFQLNIDIIGNGSVILDPQADSYLEGTVVKVTPVAGDSAYFYGWRVGAMSTKTPYYFVMDGDKSATAVFNTFNSSSFLPTDDAYLGGGENSDSNFGDSKKLYVRNTSSEKNCRKSVLRFDLRKEEYDSVDSAKLRLYLQKIYNEDTCPFVMYAIGDSWKENTVTWNNVPAPSSRIDSFRVDSYGQYVELDVTDYVNQELASDDIISVMLWDTTESNAVAYFRSKEEDENWPELVLDGISVPQKYSLDIDVIGNGNVTVEPSGTVFLEGTEVTITPVANDSAYFYAWKGDALSTDTPITLVMDDNKSLSAIFYSNDNSTFLPSDDAYLGGGENADSNYGDSAKLYVRNTESEKNSRKSVLKFDLSQADYDQVESATLRLYLQKIYNEEICPFNIYAIPDSWNEKTVTWNNVPETTSVIDTVSFDSYGHYVEMDLTEYVNQELKGDDVISLLFWDTTRSNAVAYFRSKEETENLPELVLDGMSTVQKFTLGVDVMGEGSVSIEPEGTEFPAGTVVQITPVADDGSYFYGWRGAAVNGQEAYTIVMDDNKTATAVFYKQYNTQFIPTDDAYLGGGESADSNFGDSAKLYVRNTESEKLMRKSVLKFDLSHEQYDSVDKATLRLFVQNIYNEETCPFVMYALTDDWAEGSVTWNNVPASVSVVDTFVVDQKGQYMEFDVTSFVNQELAADDVISILMWDVTQSNGVAYFRSKDEDENWPELVLDGVTGVEFRLSQVVIPDEIQLYQNYPNPFNPITTIRYDVPQAEYVTLEVFDVKGRLVSTLVDQQQSAGSYELKWSSSNNDGTTLSTGVYFYRLVIGDFEACKKMLLVK